VTWSRTRLVSTTSPAGCSRAGSEPLKDRHYSPMSRSGPRPRAGLGAPPGAIAPDTPPEKRDRDRCQPRTSIETPYRRTVNLITPKSTSVDNLPWIRGEWSDWRPRQDSLLHGRRRFRSRSAPAAGERRFAASGLLTGRSDCRRGPPPRGENRVGLLASSPPPASVREFAMSSTPVKGGSHPELPAQSHPRTREPATTQASRRYGDAAPRAPYRPCPQSATRPLAQEAGANHRPRNHRHVR
jgi:hypothetical protein